MLRIKLILGILSFNIFKEVVPTFYKNIKHPQALDWEFEINSQDLIALHKSNTTLIEMQTNNSIFFNKYVML